MTRQKTPTINSIGRVEARFASFLWTVRTMEIEGLGFIEGEFGFELDLEVEEVEVGDFLSAMFLRRRKLKERFQLKIESWRRMKVEFE